MTEAQETSSWNRSSAADHGGRCAAVRLAWVVSTPTPYKEPFFESLSACDDVNLHVLFLRWADPQRPWQLDSDQTYRFTSLSGFGIRRSLKRESYLQVNPGVFAALRKFRPDAVVVCGYDHPTMWFAMMYCFLTRTPFLQQGESHLQKPRSRMKRLLKRTLLFPVLRRCRAAFATGTGARRYWNSVGIPDRRIYTVANSPDIRRIQQAAEALRPGRDAVRRELGCTGQRVAIFVGRFDEVKGIDVLLDALRRMSVEDRPLVWLIGDGPQRADIERASGEAGLSVNILGFRQPEELPRLYAAADFFVLPSRHEPWGVVVNEAMSCGLPVVLSDQVGAGFDLLGSADDLNGYSFRSEDAEDLSRVLAQMTSHSLAELAAMGQASQRMVAQWTPQASAANVVQCLMDTGILAQDSREP